MARAATSPARKNDFKIIPICPYVKAQYRKHPEWADVMTVAPEAL